MSSQSSVDKAPAGVGEVIGSIPVRNSDFPLSYTCVMLISSHFTWPNGINMTQIMKKSSTSKDLNQIQGLLKITTKIQDHFMMEALLG